MQGQLHEMSNEQIALIGPTAGIMEQPVLLGLGIKSSILYSNFGKSPAKYADYSVYHVFTKGEWGDGTAAKSIQNYKTACMNTKKIDNATDILFPTTVNNSKSITLDTADVRNSKSYVAEQDLLNGSSIFSEMGCFVYETETPSTIQHFVIFTTPKPLSSPPLTSVPLAQTQIKIRISAPAAEHAAPVLTVYTS